MIGIYKITSPTNKIYIGQSTNIEQRWKDYNKMIRCKRQTRLYNSLKKYGPESHLFEILEECSEDKLLEKETYWKKYFKVLEIPSLCCRMDGRGGKLSEETKDKISISSLGNAKKHKYSIIEYDNSGKFVKIWDNYIELDNFNDIKTTCLKSSFTRINGSLWRFKYNDDFPKQLNLPEYYYKKLNRIFPILQYDLNGNFIKEYKNNQEVINLFLKPINKTKNSSAIHACCKGKQNKSCGFIWKYKI
jgi:group I intron endonuclease